MTVVRGGFASKVWVAALASFCLVIVALHSNHYTSDDAVYHWVALRAIFDSSELRIENLGFSAPHGVILLLAPFYLLPKLLPYGPYIVAASAVALLLALWQRHLVERGFSPLQAALLCGAMLINPALLASATSGEGDGVSLLFYYLIHAAVLRLARQGAIRDYIILGILLAIFLYFDPLAGYLMIALLPVLLLVVPVPQLRRAPVSFYLIVGLPLLMMAGAWFYFNWIFLGDPLGFIETPGSAFIGVRRMADQVPWLIDYGGELLPPLYAATPYLLFSWPVVVVLLWRGDHNPLQMTGIALLYLYPLATIALATMSYFLTSPLQVGIYMAAIVMAGIAHDGYAKRGAAYALLLLLLLLGSAGNWYLYVNGSYSHRQEWARALLYRQPQQHQAEAAVGEWLARNRAETLIDLRSGYRVVAARGDSRGLLLPFTHEYRLAMRTDTPQVAQLVLPAPDTENGRKDELNRRFPRLYEAGMEGYKRVYDADGWRVYRHE